MMTRRSLSVLALFLALCLVALGTAGCASSGSREFIPGKGWVPID